MPKDRKTKNKIPFRFAPLPIALWESQEYAELSSSAVKLLTDILAQCRYGQNNGDISITWKLMSKRGWRSESTLNKAKKELLAAGFIMKTKQGGKNSCSLYGLTWLKIESNKKFDHINDHSISQMMLKIIYAKKSDATSQGERSEGE